MTPAARSKLIAWFDANQRPLPFRHSRDPYRIWVSEVMLQQTTVAAVVPYFNRFIARFPTLTALASAEESEVLALWEGLGYYRRAKHLHAAAVRLAADFGDALPDDPDYWAELPGVGRYILGAVLSQAFDRRLPIVEANTLRVLTRLYGYRDDPRSGDGKKWLWERAEAILPRKRVGDFNQAMMELGALVCTPLNPRCEECPLRRSCVAKADGLTESIPPRASPPQITSVREVVLVLRQGQTILLGQRPAGVRWAGMWELPHGEANTGEAINETAERVAQELLGVSVTVTDELDPVKQSVTRFAITLVPVIVTVSGRLTDRFHEQLRRVTIDDARSLAMPVAQRTILSAAFSFGGQKRLFRSDAD